MKFNTKIAKINDLENFWIETYEVDTDDPKIWAKETLGLYRIAKKRNSKSIIFFIN